MLRLVKVLDVVMITLPFAACWVWYYAAKTPLDGTWQGHAVILGLYAVLFILLGKTYDAFWMSMQRVSELMYGQVLAAMATDGIFYIVICLMATKLCNLLPGIAAIAGQFVMAGIWSAVAHRWYYKAFPPQPTTVVYDVRRGMEKLIQDYGLDSKYEVKKVLSVEECLEDLSVLDGMKTVFLSGVHSHERNIILKYCVMNDINTFIIPRVGDVLMSGAWPMHMLHLPVLRVGRYMAKPEFLFVKRAMDIVLSLVALIILSPIFLITAIAVKSDGGPAFYKQVRLTKDGKPFEILKFRSMRVDAEKDGFQMPSDGIGKNGEHRREGHLVFQRIAEKIKEKNVRDVQPSLQLEQGKSHLTQSHSLLRGQGYVSGFGPVLLMIRHKGTAVQEIGQLSLPLYKHPLILYDGFIMGFALGALMHTPFIENHFRSVFGEALQ